MAGSAGSSGACTKTTPGTLWVGADSGVWRLRPGPPRRYPTPGLRARRPERNRGGTAGDGIRGKRTQATHRRQGRRLSHSQTQSTGRRCCRTTRSIRTNCCGTAMAVSGSARAPRAGPCSAGGRTPFARSDGLSGDMICSLFEDREGNIWVATPADSTGSESSRSGLFEETRPVQRGDRVRRRSDGREHVAGRT